MGCASSKKRTTSIEDLQAGGNAVNKEPILNKSKNGQVAANDTKSTPPILRETAKQTHAAPPQASSDAIQIPGAHKSFLAPDGIPFIDEDVDDDDEKTGGSGDASTAGQPDVNKNVVKQPLVNHQQPAPPAPTTLPPVVVDEVKPPTVVVAGERRTGDAPSADQKPEAPQQQLSDDAAFSAALDVLSKDLDIEPQSADNETHLSTSVTTVETTVVTTSAASQQVEPPVNDEQQLAAAAVKIQAGIRGYRDRQKVKAIRAAQHSHINEPVASVQHEDVSVSVVAYGVEHHEAAELNDAKVETEEQPVDTEDQEGERNAGDHVKSEDFDGSDRDDKERAAVKIQANYKGWKTRKEVGKVKK